VTILWAEQALTDAGWQNNVRITLTADGRIGDITPDCAPSGRRLSVALPAPGNLHSHSFQRALAGLTETRGASGQDSFWTWRHLMYSFLNLLTPKDVAAIAAFTQMEMLLAGFASVGEFHYLHNQNNGAPYQDQGEMSAQIFAATRQSGIGLTHLPVLYMQGGCDGRALVGGQLRFQNDLDGYGRLLDRCRAMMRDLPADCSLGVAPHSLRAVPRAALDHIPDLAATGPIHIHIAEQQAEVLDVIAHLGARPVEWLLNIFDVGAQWCLVHATQMTPAETRGLAQCGAVAGLCPITESNLGDGIFDAVGFLSANGTFGIGSDSNIRISLTEELRTLDYSQRLRDHSRAPLASKTASAGRVLFEKSADGAAQALGRASGRLKPGAWADIIDLDTSHPDLEGLTGDRLLDALIFARDDGAISNVWAAGRHMVKDGRHINAAAITSAYRATITKLRASL